MNRIVLVVFFAQIFFSASGQISRAWESAMALNYSVKKWSFNTSIGHRTVKERMNNEFNSRLAFWDINQFISRRVTPEITFSIGYKYRDIDPLENQESVEQRTTQQIALTHLNSKIRLVSRLRMEQRFFTNSFSHRCRYRFSFDMPLSGLNVDINELYLIASNEFLMEFSNDNEQVDNRFNLGVGYVFSSWFRLQVEYTQRSESLFNNNEQIPFFTTSAIFQL